MTDCNVQVVGSILIQNFQRVPSERALPCQGRGLSGCSASRRRACQWHNHRTDTPRRARLRWIVRAQPVKSQTGLVGSVRVRRHPHHRTCSANARLLLRSPRFWVRVPEQLGHAASFGNVEVISTILLNSDKNSGWVFSRYFAMR